MANLQNTTQLGFLDTFTLSLGQGGLTDIDTSLAANFANGDSLHVVGVETFSLAIDNGVGAIELGGLSSNRTLIVEGNSVTFSADAVLGDILPDERLVFTNTITGSNDISIVTPTIFQGGSTYTGTISLDDAFLDIELFSGVFDGNVDVGEDTELYVLSAMSGDIMTHGDVFIYDTFTGDITFGDGCDLDLQILEDGDVTTPGPIVGGAGRENIEIYGSLTGNLILGATADDLDIYEGGTYTGIARLQGFDDTVTLDGTFNGRLVTGAGNDIIESYSDTAIANGKISMGGGNDLFDGTDNNDTVRGGASADWLLGDLGDDVIRGDGGNDTIIGDRGADRMWGGDGADEFWYFLTDAGIGTRSRDKIFDFSQTDGDLLVFFDSDATFIDTAAFSNTAGEIRQFFDGTNTIVEGDSDGDSVTDFIIEITGNITLTAGDFVFA